MMASSPTASPTARRNVAEFSAVALASFAAFARRAVWRSISFPRRASMLSFFFASAASSAASTIAAGEAIDRSLGNERIG